MKVAKPVGIQKTNKLTDFNIGDNVRLTDGVLCKEYAGRIGTVNKLIKRRNFVRVVFADGQRYDASPQNVQHLEVTDNG